MPTRASTLGHILTHLPAVLALLASVACTSDQRSGNADLQIRWHTEPDPPTVGTNRVRVDVSDLDWSPENGARVILTGLREGTILEVDTALGEGAGRYVAGAFNFEVAGTWTLRARIETLDRRWTEVEHPVEVVARPPEDDGEA